MSRWEDTIAVGVGNGVGVGSEVAVATGSEVGVAGCGLGDGVAVPPQAAVARSPASKTQSRMPLCRRVLVRHTAIITPDIHTLGFPDGISIVPYDPPARN